MAPRPPRSKKPKSSLKASRANARGYAARKALKSSDALDVYEYSTGKVRRSGVGLSLGREEETGLGKDSDEEDKGLDEVKENLRLRIANADEDGVVGSDDDEEIDSDAAFEDESDEERFANFKFNGSKGKAIKGKGKATEKSIKVSFVTDVDLNEDEDEDNEPTPKPIAHGSEGSDEDSQDEEEKMWRSGSEQEMESDPEAPSVTSHDDLEADTKLADFISTLDTSSKKRKLEEGSADRAGKKRVVLQDRTEAGPEGEFGTKSGALLHLSLISRYFSDTLFNRNPNLTLSDLIAPTSSLSQSTKALQSTTKSALTAPLPQRIQDRIDREAAYEQTKQEVQKWAPTMKRIRDAEHLAFPLQGPAAGKKGTSNADVIDRFQVPVYRHGERHFLSLRAANLHTDAAAAEAENTLAAATISEEDLAARRAQLRLTRELMFRADIKAKRVAKIKSKAYRRMKKREKEKQKEAAVELGLDEGEEVDRMRAEVERAKERATLRHRTTGKWAKAMRNKGEMDEEEMGAVKILQDRAEILRRKIAGGEESSDDDDSHGEDRDIQELEELGQAESLIRAKGIMGMKFMRDAIARADREVGTMANETRLEMLGLQIDSKIENSMGDEVVGGNLGRRIYKPGQVQPPATYSDISSTLKSSDSHESPSDTRNSLPPIPAESPPPLNTLSISNSATTLEPDNTSNPWLATTTPNSGKIARKNNVRQVTKMQKVQTKSEEERTRAKEDAAVEIDIDQVLVVSEEKTRPDTRSVKETAKTVDLAYAPSDDEGSDTDEKAPAAFKQRELVAMAFAGDNVVEDFAAEKQRVIEEDAPKEVDTTLAGWVGLMGWAWYQKTSSRPNLIKKIAGVDASKRADAGLALSLYEQGAVREKYGYAYWDGVEHPSAHQRAVLPRVVKKMGTVIDPLERMF
ncbi:Utp14 protein [Rhizoctonia solani]|uniref:Utp14 protein n=1 Tax=Rhizoctonia solani TaxID=456999 RepID=A0A8H7IGA2_9AGAM|nr:Utp14 protein [Rhizoctonia solani]